MRSIFTLLIIIFCATTSFALVGTAVEGVKLMSGPGYGKQVMDFPENTPLKVLAKSGKWWKVRDYWGARGWVQKSLLAKHRMAVVSRARVNFRSGPSTGYRKIGTLYKGYALRILKTYGNWYKVKVVDPPDGGQGWIHRRLVWG